MDKDERLNEGEQPPADGNPCPACGGDVGVPADVVLGEVIWCYNCGIELEVVSIDPVQVELFEEEEK